jgi:hypothetical protein
MDDPLIAFQAGDDAAFCPVSWKLHGPTLFHGRARWPSNERAPRDQLLLVQLALIDHSEDMLC